MSNKLNTLGEGVYYDKAGYIGLLGRLAIITVDMVVVITLFIITGLTYDAVFNNDYNHMHIVHTMFVLSLIYFVLLKRTDVGTLGYFLASARIVDLNGDRPSVSRMTYRLLLTAFGPLSIIYDCLWLCNDQNKQTLRDKLAGTYVININAKPAGRGPKILTPISFFLLFYSFTEVKRPNEG